MFLIFPSTQPSRRKRGIREETGKRGGWGQFGWKRTYKLRGFGYSPGRSIAEIPSFGGCDEPVTGLWTGLHSAHGRFVGDLGCCGLGTVTSGVVPRAG